MVIKKTIKKIARKVKSAAKKRYITKTGKGVRVGQIVKDVAFLKKMINAEKKRMTVANYTTSAFGQVSGNSTGHYCLDITPVMSEGASASQRTGASIKWASSYFLFQVGHQSSTQSAIAGYIYFVKVKNNVLSSSAFVQNFLNPTPFITSANVYDTNSARNMDFYKDFIVLRKKRIYLQCDKLTGQPIQKTIKVGIKFNHHVKYQVVNNTSDTNNVTDGQVFMLFLADSGNCGTTAYTGGSYGVPIAGSNTGGYLNYNITHYYIDN